ncbi:porin [Sphaerisporangium krabiense]|uniref:Amino acid transporter n=1 Tax=Sphaerisporangium krabiense TaxID=763782 RepID=A0A7W9DT19_9ACTN|nr:APC family permease [Sphaerisporangium krabiense]MBB5630322.1 amino acid transporter [Sphaerisporangium krabiense]GII62727.1 porin [Sphaerisporangium krabiense]
MQPQETIERFGYRQELQRGIGLADLVFYGLVFMVPISPFAIFGDVYRVSNGMPALAYLIGMIALLFTASSYAQMVKAFPLSGSVYNYAGRGIARPVGFMTGWAILLDYLLAPTLLYLLASIAMNAAVPAVPVWAWLIVFVIVNTVINLRGIKVTLSLTKVMIVAELIVLALFLAAGVWALMQGKGQGFSFAPLFSADTISWPVVFGAASFAVLSFLGFDGVSMLVEESKGGSAQVGKAMKVALILAGVLFIVQVWVAALLVQNPAALLAEGDHSTAFYDVAAVAGGSWLQHTTSIATAISWGLADTLVAQVAVSRLLFAMARDRQLPAFLARVSVKHSVPVNATLLVAALSVVLGLWMSVRDDGVSLLVSMINMGALVAFIVLHVSVVVHYVLRQRSTDLLSHLIVPLVGTVILVFVVINANVMAQRLGLIWLAVGALIMIAVYVRGRRPDLSGFTQ